MTGGLLAQFAVSTAMLVLSAFTAAMTYAQAWPDAVYFPATMLWLFALFAMIGMTAGNLNAIAMEPLGHIAGLAASIILAVPTVLATLIAAPLGLAFDGTPGPLALGSTLCCALALAAMPQLRPR